MVDIKENIDGTSVEKFDELQPQFDIEFEDYKAANIAGLRKEYNQLVEMKVIKQEDIEPKLKNKEQEFLEMDIYKRIATIVNNFHLWWPGGYYRQLLLEREADNTANEEKIILDENMIKDLDELIRQQGYGSVAENIAKRENIERELRLKILLDIYLKMRSKGYERAQMVK